MTERSAPAGVAALADKPANPRRATLVVGVCGLVVTALGYPVTDALYDTANTPPPVLATVRLLADPPATGSSGPTRSAVLVLVDGLRADEADRMPSLRGLHATVRARMRIDLPTLSRVAYHTFLTGASPAATGVRTNRFLTRARLDSLADRVRAARGHVSWISEGNDWMARMFARPGDADAHDPNGLGAPLDAALVALAVGRPSLVVVHVLEVDRVGHDHGVLGAARRRAVANADRVVARVSRGAERADAVLVVLADHGHIAVGGHGGDEPEVQDVAFVARVPGRSPAHFARTLAASEVAPTLAAWMGVPPPRTAIASAVPSLATAVAPTRAPARAALVRASELSLAARLAERRLGLGLVVTLAFLMALGATKRAFGFAAATVVAPAVTIATVLAVHVGAWGRPLTASAIDDIDRHGPLLVGLGVFAAVSGIMIALAVVPTSTPWRVTVRRAAAACALDAVAAGSLSIVWCGGALGPWSLSAHAFHAPILTCAIGAGVCAAAALLSLVTLLRERAGGATPAGERSPAAS